ncbi:MAG: hypothetical protein EBR82_38310 [Caulobacteraceae bacterium]|nr:hypothetical protein [Caulobacteraceae bacterium]
MSDLDKLLGFPKPIADMTDAELTKALTPHFPFTRPVGSTVDDLLKDPLMASIPGLADMVKQQQKFTMRKS